MAKLSQYGYFVVVAPHHNLVRNLFRQNINYSDGCTLGHTLIEEENPITAWGLIETINRAPDLVIIYLWAMPRYTHSCDREFLDLRDKKLPGFWLAKRIAEKYPTTKIILYGPADEQSFMTKLQDAQQALPPNCSYLPDKGLLSSDSSTLTVKKIIEIIKSLGFDPDVQGISICRPVSPCCLCYRLFCPYRYFFLKHCCCC